MSPPDQSTNAATKPKKGRPLGINHVVLEVDDVDAALDFYGTFLDFRLRGEKTTRNAFIDLGDQFIQIRRGPHAGAGRQSPLWIGRR